MSDSDTTPISSSSTNFRPQSREDVQQTILTAQTSPQTASMLAKHGKYVLVGLGGSYWSDIFSEISRVMDGKGGWIRKLLILGIGAHVITILIFLYLVLFLPYFRGYIPNYPKWQQSARLRVIVPVLTATIFFGWTSYVISLSRGTRLARPDSAGTDGMGTLRAMVGTTALYTLTLGVLGLIRAPKGTPIRKKGE